MLGGINKTSTKGKAQVGLQSCILMPCHLEMTVQLVAAAIKPLLAATLKEKVEKMKRVPPKQSLQANLGPQLWQQKQPSQKQQQMQAVHTTRLPTTAPPAQSRHHLHHPPGRLAEKTKITKSSNKNKKWKHNPDELQPIDSKAARITQDDEGTFQGAHAPGLHPARCDHCNHDYPLASCVSHSFFKKLSPE